MAKQSSASNPNETQEMETAIAHYHKKPCPERARVTLELSPKEMKGLLTAAIKMEDEDLAYQISLATAPLQANLNRLINMWKKANQTEEDLPDEPN